MSVNEDNLKKSIDAAMDMVRRYRPIHELGAKSNDARLHLDTIYVEVYLRNAAEFKRLGELVDKREELKGRAYISLGKQIYPAVERIVVFFKSITFQETGHEIAHGPPLKKKRST